MEILILSVTAGGGHNSAAAALTSEFRLLDGIKLNQQDLYKYCNGFLYNIIDRGYTFWARHFPKLFGSVYNGLENPGLLRKFVSIALRKPYLSKKLSCYFKDYMPDAIITTHVFAALVLSDLKLRGVLNIPIIGLVTDYCIHPFWDECPGIEYIVTAGDFLNYSASKKGIDMSRILPFGIPVKPKFHTKFPKEKARLELGLAPNKRTILVMGGSMGYGGLLATIKELMDMPEEQKVICICANNRRLYDSLQTLRNPNLHIKGFVNNPELYMDAADCILTKPGGMTVSEILAKKLPAILLTPIPGPEDRNMDFLLSSGGAIRCSKHLSPSEAVYQLFSNSDRLTHMEKALSHAARPNAARRICNFTIDALKNPAVN